MRMPCRLTWSSPTVSSKAQAAIQDAEARFQNQNDQNRMLVVRLLPMCVWVPPRADFDSFRVRDVQAENKKVNELRLELESALHASQQRYSALTAPGGELDVSKQQALHLADEVERLRAAVRKQQMSIDEVGLGCVLCCAFLGRLAVLLRSRRVDLFASWLI